MGFFFARQDIFQVPLLHGSAGFHTFYNSSGTPIALIPNHFTTNMVLSPSKLNLMPGPVLRLAPDMVDILSAEATFQGWGGKTDTKLPWDKDPEFCEAVRGGLSVDNVLSIQTAKESQRMRRLVGPPFAKKFLLDQEQIFKTCTKTLIMSLESHRKQNNNKVDVLVEFRKYAFDILSNLIKEIR